MRHILATTPLVALFVSALLLTPAEFADAYTHITHITPTSTRATASTTCSATTSVHAEMVRAEMDTKYAAISRRQVMHQLGGAAAFLGPGAMIISPASALAAGEVNTDDTTSAAAATTKVTKSKKIAAEEKRAAEKREKEARRIAKETKQRLAAGRIGTI
mmetsp:Transcript_31584/g.64287  ORF Transcript_31584/g.64287 Transcript_31584/m.64287 type:complete len:160 (+) Transcript_31584:484-963(+)